MVIWFPHFMICGFKGFLTINIDIMGLYNVIEWLVNKELWILTLRSAPNPWM